MADALFPGDTQGPGFPVASVLGVPVPSRVATTKPRRGASERQRGAKVTSSVGAPIAAVMTDLTS